MRQVRIITYSSIKSLRARSGAVGYLLEVQTSKGPATLTGFADVEATANASALLAVIEALKRLKEPCALEVYSESEYVAAGVMKWMEDWARNGWFTSRMKEVANRAEWEQLYGLLEKHSYIFKTGHTEYSRWLAEETDKRAAGFSG